MNIRRSWFLILYREIANDRMNVKTHSLPIAKFGVFRLVLDVFKHLNVFLHKAKMSMSFYLKPNIFKCQRFNLLIIHISNYLTIE